MAEAKPPKILSCASCRQRKTKCDKAQPVCADCSRLGVECIYPSRKPTRRTVRPRQRQSELLQRIRRLEGIIGQADPDRLRELDGAAADATPPPPSADGDNQSQGSKGEKLAIPQRPKVPDPSKSKRSTKRYLGDEFWTNLCDEVDGLKHVLDEPSDQSDDNDDDSDEEEDDGVDGGSHIHKEPSGFVLGNTDYHERDRPVHPDPPVVLTLWSIYLRNVDPLVKIIHRPTMSRKIQELVTAPPGTSLPSSLNALMFAIYFAAVTTLDESAAQEKLGQPQNVLAAQFRIGTERALAAADYLNTHSLETLQAFTIYLAVLRASSMGRASWVLTSSLVRIAQAMNLHRDGLGCRFPAFEREMRRRLWYFVVTLDMRAAEDRGTDAILMPWSSNTAPPTNIDDDGFGPESVGPLTPKEGPADNVIGDCMRRCSALGTIFHPRINTDAEAKRPEAAAAAASSGEDSRGSALTTEGDLLEIVRGLEKDFIRDIDPTNFNAMYASKVARLVILKVWLMAQYPYSAQPTVVPMRASRETMLRTAVSVMELSEALMLPPWEGRFDWWTRCYIQWHPLAVALAELCVQTQGDVADGAWRVVERVFPRWKKFIADSARGSLWRPIKKLYRRAKEARKTAPADGAPPPVATTRMQQQPVAPINVPPYPPPPPIAGHGYMDVLPITCTQMAPDTTDRPEYMPLTDFTDPFDVNNVDLAYLFEYPTEVNLPSQQQQQQQQQEPQDGSVYYSGSTNLPYDMSPWNQFITDTQMNYSPEGSTGDDSL